MLSEKWSQATLLAKQAGKASECLLRHQQHPPPLPGGVRGQQHGSADRNQAQIRSQLSLARLGEKVPNSEAKRGAALCLACL